MYSLNIVFLVFENKEEQGIMKLLRVEKAADDQESSKAMASIGADKKKEEHKNKVKHKFSFMFLANMKIATKILVGFLIIAILSTAMGAYAALSLKDMSNSSRTMYGNILLPTKAVAELHQNFQDACNSLRQALLLEDGDTSLLAVLSPITSSKQTIASRFSTVETLLPPEKADAFKAAKEAYDAFDPLLEKAVEDIKNGNKAAVAEELVSFGELRSAESNLSTALKELMFAVTGDAATISTQNNKTGEKVLLITVIAIGAVLILSVLIGIILTRGISRPIKKLTKNITKLASGETDFELDNAVTKDEVGKMREATRTILHVIKGLEDDTSMLIDAAMEGQLTVRADAQKHQGAYRHIVEGINATLDAMIKPIKESAQVLSELAKGNLSVSVSSEFKGDFALIKTALNETIDTLKGYISDITYVLGEMAEGELTVNIDSEYVGDFAAIKKAINKSIASFNSVLVEINAAAEEVSGGTEQVSDSSQAISQGASDQATALEQLAASASQIAEQTKMNAERAGKANELSLQAKDNALSGNEKMKLLLAAMEEINVASASISRIIKVIDDIAFQTNILALNAAVEAARAGVHGKGFAVVAEEVRNLAAKSAQAAKETTDLIDGSIKKTKAGTDIANVTAKALVEIVNGVETTVSLSGEIASSSNEQAAGINQINRGINQLSAVVQNNSATAQEVAASSQEISGQANILKDMVGRFSLSQKELPESKTPLLESQKNK